MAKVSDIKNLLQSMENKIVRNDPKSHSNLATMQYYATLGLYKFLGGKEKVGKRVLRTHVTDHLPTDRAKTIYIEHAIQYSTIAVSYFKFLKIEQIYKKKNMDSTLLFDEISNILYKDYRPVNIDYLPFEQDFHKLMQQSLTKIANELWGLNIEYDKKYFEVLDKTYNIIRNNIV